MALLRCLNPYCAFDVGMGIDSEISDSQKGSPSFADTGCPFFERNVLKLRQWPLIICLLFCGISECFGFAPRSFVEWRTAKISEAQSVVKTLQRESKKWKKNGRRSSSKVKKRLSARLRQAKLNLEVAKELNVDDYNSIYLSQIRDRATMIQIAKKLTPQETADLILILKKHRSPSDFSSSDAEGILPFKRALNEGSWSSQQKH